MLLYCTRCLLTDDFLVCFRLSDYKQTEIQDEDDDVAAERQRIYDGGSKADILQIRDLSKVKKKKKEKSHNHNIRFMLNFRL